MKERLTTTSIGLEPSKIDDLDRIAIQNGFRSRNQLIVKILTDFIKKSKDSELQ
jgi:metal-responsive CopG/Arc/MetJ family transcriptional regulator